MKFSLAAEMVRKETLETRHLRFLSRSHGRQIAKFQNAFVMVYLLPDTPAEVTFVIAGV